MGGQILDIQTTISSRGEDKYLLLSHAAQSHYLHEGDYRVKRRDADEYEVVKSLALAASKENRIQRMKHQPVCDSYREGKCYGGGIEVRKDEVGLRISLGCCGGRETGFYLGYESSLGLFFLRQSIISC